jgi:hypothetical protein
MQPKSGEESFQFKVWNQRVDGPNEERQIAAEDWRDPDRVQHLDGIRVQSNDLDWQESHNKSEPDWSAGFYGMDQQGRKVDLLAIFKQACLEGRVLYGIAIARDEQRHGI